MTKNVPKGKKFGLGHIFFASLAIGSLTYNAAENRQQDTYNAVIAQDRTADPVTIFDKGNEILEKDARYQFLDAAGNGMFLLTTVLGGAWGVGVYRRRRAEKNEGAKNDSPTALDFKLE